MAEDRTPTGEVALQPWSKGDARVPLDRAFLQDIVDQVERRAAEREERLLRAISPVRWYFTWLLLSLAMGIGLGVLYIIALQWLADL